MRAALAAALLTAAGLARAEGPRPWWAPDHAKLQLAGNIGFLSPGVGWAWRRVDSDVFAGWVPRAIGGADIFSATGKLTFRPWRLERARWRVTPITGTLQLTYTFGRQYSALPADDLPPTAWRTGVALGAALGREVGRTAVDVYAELVALDVGIAYWIGNRRALGLGDVVSVAIGVRVEL